MRVACFRNKAIISLRSLSTRSGQIVTAGEWLHSTKILTTVGNAYDEKDKDDLVLLFDWYGDGMKRRTP